MPDRVSSQVNAWGKKYQEEEKKNKSELLNCLQLQCDWENDELEESEGLIEELVHPDLPAQFPGMELERELDIDPYLCMFHMCLTHRGQIDSCSLASSHITAPVATYLE